MTRHERDQDLDELVDRVSHALDVPEPSPLFWDHFPARVRRAIDAAPGAARAPWWTRRAAALVMSIAIVGLLSVWAWSSRAPVLDVTEHPGSADAALAGPAAFDGEFGGWQAMSAVAASAGVDGLREAGFGIAPGDADAAIEALTDAERATLFTLLQAEIDGDDSGGL